MTLESERKKAAGQKLYNIVELQISEIIAEINLLCQDLSPTEIEILGIVEATKHYLLKMAKEKNKLINFIHEDTDLEKIILQDKLSIFRIIQNLLKIGFDSAAVENMKVALKYKAPCVNIRLYSNCKIPQNVNLKAYNEIACRVDYYAGKISEIFNDSESMIEIAFSVTTG